ncbi:MULTISPECIES: alginate lyase family protein [Paraburkholderia]|uniref:alginate lyase family protein n=1 Tax=Paraburkholderia TaxID=1822464 RepID=UPI002258D8F8|nr:MULTISPECIES: alginate lyase family protein [Paraburkholderia]MCX4164687.1 alginate lyase family protein [Paraburkholderia megapolitana]MDN7160180.1 alginate lyase family protein [Paraburkholderia sp. CHISQ3]MDQ6497227.1 alginate lyase family protein [Paraburkholderia megapolitana]
MARMVRTMQCRSVSMGGVSTAATTDVPRRRETKTPLAAMLLGGMLLLGVQHARAAMNFCAAPALQASERTNADLGVKALVANVQAHLNDPAHAVARLHTEGTLPHEGIYDQSVEAEKDLDLLRDAALAWRATSDDRYLKFVDRLLYAWVTTYQPSFNPIDETHFEGLILAYDMTASALPVKTRNAAMAFLTKLANGYIEQIDAQPRPLTGTYRNNWQSHRVKLISMAAFTLDNRKMIDAAQRLFVEHVGDNIAPDGSTVDFAERDALHYVTYDLQPLVTAALAARRHNRNWLPQRAASGASLAAAMNWLTPYALGTKTHEEFVHSNVPFDAKRREAGLPGYAGPWDPKSATELFHLAARLDGRYAPIALRLAPTPPAWLAVCLPLPAR